MVDQDANIAFLYRDVVRANSNLPAIVTESVALSHGQLLGAAVALARKFSKLGVDRNAIVALNTGDAIISTATLLATALIGCQMVTASEILANQNLKKPTHFFRTFEAAGKKGVGFVEITGDWFADTPENPIDAVDQFAGYSHVKDPWLILHTSGTTGKPKFLELTHRVVRDRTLAITDDFPTAAVTCAMLFNPTSRPFFARAIGALMNACTIVHSQTPAFWKTAGVNTVFCSPSQFEAFIAKNEFTFRFRKVEVSGAKLEDDVARSLAKWFDTIIDVYGASETNKSYMTEISVDDAGEVTRTGMSCGSEIEIRDSEGRLCLPGKLGTVRVRNSYLVDGYVENPDATAKAFIDGWFLPGDIARWGANGTLNIAGRTDEVISFGGVKIDAFLIDTIIKSTPGVRDAISIRSPKSDRREIVAFVVFEDDINRGNCLQEIRTNYQAYTGLPCFLGPLHPIAEVPYDEDGRPMRYLCEQMLLANATKATETEAARDVR